MIGRLSNFRKDLDEFVNRIRSIKEHLHSEEATKTSLILPFIQLLGYDVFNPLVVMPEYIADVGIKKGEKVDYAILKDGNPLILIEAKSVGTDLSKYYSQLFRYFTVTAARIAILTDGIRYNLYTDTLNPNIMDSEPFLVFDLLDLNDDIISIVELLRSNTIDVDLLVNNYRLIYYKHRLEHTLSECMLFPSDEYIRLLFKYSTGEDIKDIYLENIKNIVVSFYNDKYMIGGIGRVTSNILTDNVSVKKENNVNIISNNTNKNIFSGVTEIGIHDRVSGVVVVYVSLNNTIYSVTSLRELYEIVFKYIVSIKDIDLNSLLNIPIKLSSSGTAGLLLSDDKELLTIVKKRKDKGKIRENIYYPIEIEPGIYLNTNACRYLKDLLRKINLLCDYFGVDKQCIKLGVMKSENKGS